MITNASREIRQMFVWNHIVNCKLQNARLKVRLFGNGSDQIV